MLTTITVMRAQVGSVKNGRLASWAIQPRLRRSTLTAPFGCSMVFIISNDTNMGTAQDNTKQNRQKPLAFVSFLLIIRESIIPKM